jgi:DNA polymerase III subunit delta'
MTLHRVYGHDALIDRLGGAISSGRFPQAALLTGPAGVGKQRIALWIAETILCSTGARPCGACQSCRQLEGLVHPDLHWFIPVVPNRRSSDPDKQIEEVEEQLAETLAERRQRPLYEPLEGRASHAIASVRLLQRKVALKPFQGSRKIIILGDAERLVVQEGSQEAANALLKVLEEPPDDTVILVTAEQPQALLPTIRSRLTPIRVGPIADAPAAAFVAEQLGATGRAAERIVAQMAGRPGNAIATSDEAGTAEKRAELLLSAIGRGPVGWSEQALLQQPWDARGGFTAMLDALSVRLRRRMTGIADGSHGDAGDLDRYVRAMRVVEEHRSLAQGNVNPQVALAVLAGDLEALRS